MSIGRISNSLASATFENSISLFAFNFDFTFKKTTPPIEFHPVGQALSLNRRMNAENGAAHRTARKLGWLFEQIVPTTPKLLKAYGLRVCEILQIPGINPSGSASDGPFREYVGADCTSLWAAATSGIPALGVHLLACMLARAWDAQTATAIWVELVKARQAEIFEQLSQNHVVSETSVTAARQDFLRSELGDWDASARSWLAQADKARAAQRDQYLLIVKNISLSTGNNKDPYANVIPAWTSAMSTMERHFEGVSQQVSDGAALYAISAWHLYPNLAYFGAGAKAITFSDPLFTEKATMSLGLTEIAATKENRGTHWSLCLSHLRFYGDPVAVESVEDRTRATISQFRVIILGSVLESWRVPLQERLDAVRWIADLWEYLKNTAPLDSSILSLVSHTSWLALLAQAANTIVSAQGSMLEQYEDYLSHGELWARRFLLDSTERIRPYFGLCNPMILQALQEPLDIDAGIEYLRQVAQSIGLPEDGGIICYTEVRDGKGYYEYCTAIPHMDPANEVSHARWIRVSSSPPALRGRQTGCQHVCHQNSVFPNVNEADLAYRAKMVTERGEQCFHLDTSNLHDRNVSGGLGKSSSSYLFWENPPPLFKSSTRPGSSEYIHEASTSHCHKCSCLTPELPSVASIEDNRPQIMEVVFERYTGMVLDDGNGREGFFELYVKASINGPIGMKPSTYWYDMEKWKAMQMTVKPSTGSEWLKSSLPNPVRVWDYIECFGAQNNRPKLIVKESISIPGGLDWEFSHARAANLISNHILSPPSAAWLNAVELCGVINEIYQHLPGATISLSVLEYPITDAHWATASTARDDDTMGKPHGVGEILQRMGREEVFACIAMMQTGSSNIDPDDLIEVMAISSDNSIFVSEALLSDPHQNIASRAIRHIVGNVGYSGLNLMVSPAGTLKICSPKNEVHSSSHRSNYDFKRQDHFEGSSLHLTFTGQRFPVIATDIDTIDQGIFFLQSVVSLWSGGNHVADLNILDVQRTDISRVKLDCKCEKPSTEIQDMDIRCLNSWEDVLRPPRRMAVMRSHSNWPARLAAAAMFIQQGREHSVALLPPEPLCWTCLEGFFTTSEVNWPEILID